MDAKAADSTAGTRETLRYAIRFIPLLARVELEIPRSGERPGIRVQFPYEVEGRPRLRYDDGDHIVEWDGQQWARFVKEGSRWYQEALQPIDLEILYIVLRNQLRDALKSETLGIDY